ncbi:MAG TPA: hypothetical protein VFT99_13220, partial [Roseiflexaceae bacterium]|nr:hypothetical protein [Roseiflexaceae bacterium]
MTIDHVQALSGQAGLAGIQSLMLDTSVQDRLRGALCDLLQEPYTLGEMTLQRAKYKPGRHLTTYYAVQVAAPDDTRQSRLIEVSWRMPGSPDPRGEAGAMNAMQADARTHGCVQPFRALMQTITDLDCYIQLFPLDADFPNLVQLSDPVAVTRMLQEAQLGYTGSPSYEVTPVRYRPGQRHVLRYDPLDSSGATVPRSALFAKLYNNDKGIHTVAVARNVSEWLAEQNRGIHAVRPSGYVEPLDLALYPYVDGVP